MDNIQVLMMPDYRADNPYQGLLAKELEAEGCRVVFPCGYRRVLPLYRAVRDERGTNLLHLHWSEPYIKGRSLPAYSMYAAKFLADVAAVRMSGCRIVWTLHNLLPHDTRYRRLELFTRRRLCRMASAVIVHGPVGRDEAAQTLHCPADRIFVIPHGHYRSYGTSLPQSEARRQLGLPSDGRVLMFFGFPRPYKGLELLLDAWRKLDARDAVLLVVGQSQNAGYTAELRQMAEGLPGVRIVGRFIPPDEVPLYFSAADAVVLPFRAVQTSGSVILAMSYGRPVIAPRLGELPETLAGADDLLFACGDEDDLRRKLAEALENDLSDLAARTVRACDRLDWGPIAAATADVYRRALGRTVVSGSREHGARCRPSTSGRGAGGEGGGQRAPMHEVERV